MSLRAAIDSLSRRLGYVAGAAAPCAECGPRATPARTTVIRGPGMERAACSGCGRDLDHVGAPIGVPTPRGVYTLEIRTDDVEPPPIT